MNATEFFVIIIELAVHDNALSVQFPDEPRSLHYSIPFQEGLFNIHEQFMAALQPGLCTRVSPKDRRTL